jgi:PAS domain-containing protein
VLAKSEQEALGNCLQVGGPSVHDATHIISTAEELARLRAALSAAGDVAYDWDLATDTIHWSGDICRALGIPQGYGTLPPAPHFAALVTQEDLAAHANFLTRLQVGRVSVRVRIPAEIAGARRLMGA